jgi:hypothetical protein
MKKEILNIMKEELERAGISFVQDGDTFVINKGEDLEGYLYVEDRSEEIRVGATFEHRSDHAVALDYDKKKNEISKFRVIIPKISTFEGRAIDSLFFKLIYICTLVSKKIFGSDMSPQVATLEREAD